MRLKVGSLFAGIGGMALAARWLGWEQVFFAETNPYASAVLAKNFPHVPNYGDVRGIIGQAGSVDVLTGGFPCQGISVIGKGRGLDDERSGLWGEYARLIGEIRPRAALIENSPALRTRGLERVLCDINALGYDAEWHCLPASALGAAHRRDRIFIVAERQCTYASDCIACPDCDEPYCELHAEHYADCPCLGPDNLADAYGEGLEGYTGHGAQLGEQEWQHAQSAGSIGAACLRARRDAEAWWLAEPGMGRVATRVPRRMDRLIGLGNTVVPWVALPLLDAIQGRLRGV